MKILDDWNVSIEPRDYDRFSWTLWRELKDGIVESWTFDAYADDFEHVQPQCRGFALRSVNSGHLTVARIRKARCAPVVIPQEVLRYIKRYVKDME